VDHDVEVEAAGLGACRKTSLSRVAVGGVERVSMTRHFFGHTSTQALQVQQRSLSIVHSLSGLLTTIASVGQRLAQAPQKMQASMSIAMLPLLRAVR
jgi:hypothetical protein